MFRWNESTDISRDTYSMYTELDFGKIAQNL